MLQIESLRIPGLLLIKPAVFTDERGYFFESYQRDQYVKAGINVSFVQDNVSFSHQNVLRGLHYQECPGQAKLVSALAGRIWDVAVDIRPSSPTFGCWEAIELSEHNHWQLFIPIGFAHGYCVLSHTACISYKVSNAYDPLTERTLCWDDPSLAISWPIQSPILSKRDRNGVPLNYDRYISLKAFS